MREQEIRPKELFDEYLRLSELDVDKYFKDGPREDVPCPGCGMNEPRFAFNKLGFQYVECTQCDTLYLSPRPPASAFDRFYSDSDSASYWGSVFFPAVAEVRRETIFRPRVRKIADLCASLNIAHDVVADVGAGYGLFLEEWKRNVAATQRLVAVEPNSHLAELCRHKGYEVSEKTAENATDLHGIADLVTCFEVIEHCTDTARFVSSLLSITKPGGYVLVTGLCVDGFDIQVLWERSKSVFPPHHINFLSKNGARRLFERMGFEDITITTPGVLDVDITLNALNSNPDILPSRFEKKILSSGQKVQAEFQDFLTKNGFSSHCWILSRRPAG